MSKNSIDKRITYGTIKDTTFNIYRKGGSVEDKPKPNNVLNFPIKPNMPLYDWYKSNKKEFKQVASIDDIGPFLTKFVSEKQLRKMSESEVENLLQDLLDRGLL